MRLPVTTACSTCTRRALLAGLGAAAFGTVLAGCGGDSSGVAVDAPPTPPDASHALVLDTSMSMYSPLATVGGSLIVNTPTDKLIVVRVSQTSVAALSAICTHAGCTVSYSTSIMKLNCPCHGAQFSLTGQVTRSPATVPLKVYTASLSGTVITIQLA